MEYSLAFILCGLTLLFFYRTHLFGGELRFTLDKFDPLIQASRLEHWFGVFRGWYDWRDPIYFYPERGVLGYNDGYFLYGVFYSALRVFGIDPLISMELTTAIVRGVGFLAAWALLRRYFGSSVPTAAFGTVLMTISNGVYLGTWHTQLATVAFVPLVFFMAARIWELLIQERLRAAGTLAAGLAIFLAGWLMTAFYTFWFTGLFVLITIGVFAMIGRAQLVAMLREMLRDRRWRVLVPGIAIFVVGLIPFAMTYLPTARATGMHPIGQIYIYTPHLVDLVNVGPSNLLWSRFSGWLHDIVLGPTPESSELWEGFTPIELAVLCTAASLAWVATDTRSRNSLIYRSLLIAIFIGMALQVQVHGMTLWSWIYKLVPGAPALRVVVRFQLVLLTIGALVVAIALEKLARNRQIWHRNLAFLVAGVILVEQVNAFQIARFTRSDVSVLGAVPPHPKECRVFYTVHPVLMPEFSGDIVRNKYYVHSVEAMLLATMTRMPTVLGMDSFQPPGWNLYSPLAGDYDARVYLYALRRGLLQGLCAFDLSAMNWRLIDRPPKVPHTHPLGSGLEDRDQVGFAEGQPGVAMLAEGWSEPENWGVWATGTRSTLSLRLSGDPFSTSGVTLRVTTWAFLPPGIDNKKLDVFLDEPVGANPFAQWILGRAAEKKELCIPAKAIPSDRLVTLTFKADRSYSPAEVENSADYRVLNIAVRGLSVHAESCSAISQ